MENVYQLIREGMLLGETEIESRIYCRLDSEVVRYITTDMDGSNHNYYESTKHPLNLNDEERYRVLEYCLGRFDEDEIVHYEDLFLQGEFIIESNIPKNYELSDKWFE